MKVLIIDDHLAIQKIVKDEVLQIQPDAEIIACSSFEDAINFLNCEGNVDYVISDLELKVGCNSEIMNICRQNRLPLMVYSSHVNKVLMLEVEANRVKCYVSKGSEFYTLGLGISALFRNESYFCPIVLGTIQSRTKFKSTERLEITKGQKKILELLSKGFNREEVAQILKIKNTTLNNQIARAREMNFCENMEELIRRFNFWDHS